MKPAWHGLGLRCLVIALCLAACNGSSAPSDDAVKTSEAVAGTPALIFFTPETEPSFSQEAPQALATDPETVATVEPLSGVPTPVLVFFTPSSDQTNQPDFQVDGGTPVVAPESGDGTLAPQFTRVALPRIASATIMPRPTRLPVTPRATAETQASLASDEGPIARWPKGWGLAVGGVFLLFLAVWLFARRRS